MAKPTIPLSRDRDRPLFNAGVEEGKRLYRTKALTFLEAKYLSPDIGRGTPEGLAILKVAQELSAELTDDKK